MELKAFSRLISLLLVCLSAFAQGTTSRVTGTVQDSTGAIVSAAKVTLLNEGTRGEFVTTTSDAGTYVFEAVQAGAYTVSVEAPGFKKFSSRSNKVDIGQPTTVNVSLEVGTLTEQVEVVSTAELVQTSTSGNIGNVLTEKLISDLPIVGTRGRNPLDLVKLQPGVVDGANTGGGTHVNGARDRAWNFTLDGIDNNDTSAGGSNFSPTRANPDSIAEYRVITSNPTAETGRNSGASVQLITKSGTNEFHGNGFWFYRTPRLNANEWANNLTGIGKAKFVQNIYGGSLGGPIIRNKTFFFVNIQRLAAGETRSQDRLVYTAEARKGNWRYVAGGRNRPAGTTGASVDTAGNPVGGLSIASYNVAARDPQRIGIDPKVKAQIDLTPLPNNFTGGDGLNTALYSWAAPNSERQQDNTVKVDHIFNSKNAVFFRAAWGYQNSLCDSGNAGWSLFPDQPCVVNTERHPRNYAANWRYSPTARITNEFVFGQSGYDPNFVNPQAQLNGIEWSSIPVVVPATVVEAGNQRTTGTVQFVDNLSYNRGAHAFKFGTNIRNVKHDDLRGSIAGANVTEIIDFDRLVNTIDPATFGLPADINLANDRPELERSINFLLGRVGRITRGFASNGSSYVADIYRFQARFGEYDYYVQDSWKVRRNITVDLGLRWEIKGAPTEKDGLIRHPSQALVYGAPGTTSASWQPGSVYKTDWKDLGPSIGIAWDPYGNGKTSIRSNFRIAYDRINSFVLSSAVFQNLPGITLGSTNTEYGQNGGRLPSVPLLAPPAVKPDSLAQPIPYSDNTITVVDPNFKAPRTNMWSFGIQREILPKTVFSIDYIGRRAYHLIGAYNANQTEIFKNGFLDAFKVAQAGGESALLDRITSADSRRNATETGAAFIRRSFSSELKLNSVAAVASSLARRIQGGRSALDLAGVSPYFFYPYPQFGAGVRVIDSNDFSTYHGVTAQIEHRFSGGLAAQFSYTLSKSLDTRSFDPAFTVVGTGSSQTAASTPFDNGNRKLNYAPSDFDRRHVINSYWLYELPFGRGKKFGANSNVLIDRIIGGWQVAGFLRYQTGRPFTVFSGSNTLSNVNQSPANCNGCSPGDGHVFADPSSSLIFYFDEATRAKFSTPAPGTLGNTGRNFFRTAANWNMDTSVSKRFYIREKMNMEVRADATNLTNTPTWDNPTADITSSTFGRLRTPLSQGARKIQLGAKFNF